MTGYEWGPAKKNEVVLADLFRRSNICFLVGSGISLDSPSQLPTGYQYTKRLLSEVVPLEKIEQVLGLTNTELVGGLKQGRFLRFEQLVQLVSKIDPQLKFLDEFATCDAPNSNHLALANLITAGHKVFTTNFDYLIECALAEIDVPHSQIRPVMYREDWENADSDSVNSLYKLHGSLRNFRDGSSGIETVQAMISQIARGKQNGIQLEPWKRDVLQSALQENDLIVVGYSGLDDFDILPAIQGIESDKRIIWVEHSQNIPIEKPEIEVVRAAAKTRGHDRLGSYLLSLIGLSRHPENLIRIRVNSKLFLQSLLKQRCPDVAAGKPVQSPRSQKKIESTLQVAVSEARKWYLAGEIYSYFDCREAIDLFNHSLSLAKKDGDHRLQGQCFNFLGRQYENLFDEAELSSPQSPINWQSAKEHYDEALKIFTTISEALDQREESRVLNNIGMLYRRRSDEQSIKTAKDYFGRALRIDNAIDNLEGQSAELANLGAADYALGDLDSAIQYCDQACDIDRTLGDLAALGVHLSNVGKFRCNNADESGLSDLQSAIEIGRALGSLYMVANTYAHLGFYYAGQERWQIALECYDSAIEYGDAGDTILVESFRRSRNAIRKRLSLEERRAGTDSMNTISDDKKTQPASIDHTTIEEIEILFPAGQSIADDQVVSILLASYRQVNPDLYRRMEETRHWTGLKVGYGEFPPNPENGMMGAAYKQAQATMAKGKTVLIQGGLEISKESRGAGWPSEIWLLTVARTPAGETPNIGFVLNGALKPR